MFEFVFKDQFYSKLAEYLNSNAYKSVDSEVLLQKLSEIRLDGIDDTSKFLRSWTTQSGFPYLNLSKLENETFRVTQQKFKTKDSE